MTECKYLYMLSECDKFKLKFKFNITNIQLDLNYLIDFLQKIYIKDKFSYSNNDVFYTHITYDLAHLFPISIIDDYFVYINKQFFNQLICFWESYVENPDKKYFYDKSLREKIELFKKLGYEKMYKNALAKLILE